jgi:2-keto-3-deoxy-L-rhamnonate aldolase RhmA
MTEGLELRNPALERMRAGDVALGMVVRLGRSGDIARIARSSGHDFIFIDMQHALYSVETIGHIAQAALGCGIAALVRVRSVDDPNMALLLDSGVTGIVVPDVSSVADAERAVALCRFAPTGRRSVSSLYPMFDFRAVPLTESMRSLDASTLLVCMIESVEGLEHATEIAAVAGVDVLHLGCSDLLADMGKPGAFDDPELAAAIARLISATRAQGKFAGLGGDRDPERQVRYIDQGIQFLTTQSDIGFLAAAAAQRTHSIRAAIAPRR